MSRLCCGMYYFLTLHEGHLLTVASRNGVFSFSLHCGFISQARKKCRPQFFAAEDAERNLETEGWQI